MDVNKEYFSNITSRERAIFEGAISMGALFHQFVGTPFNKKTAPGLEKAIEESLGLQPAIEKVEVHIDLDRLDKAMTEFEYTSLNGDMLDVKIYSKIDDVLVIPSWEDIKPSTDYKYILHIDPGTAFGTGAHETTQLCIRQLKKYVNSETNLLDVGTGSGILAILSLMFGAKHAVGTDLDPCAVEAVKDNMKNNNMPEDRFRLIIGNIIDNKEIQDEVGYEKYDIVVANILADVLVPLTPVIVNQMKPGAVYITSGIINDNDKEFRVKNAVEAAGLEVVETTYQGEWVSVTARKDF